jgi:hypothetical protein
LRVDLSYASPFDAADFGEAAVLDRNVGAHPGISQSIEEAAVANHDVVHRRRLGLHAAGGRQIQHDSQHSGGNSKFHFSAPAFFGEVRIEQCRTEEYSTQGELPTCAGVPRKKRL